MKNWLLEYIKEIKVWFDIDNYCKFEDISLNVLYYEFWVRVFLYKSGFIDEEKKGLWVYMIEIFSGNFYFFKGKYFDYLIVNDIFYSFLYIFIMDIIRFVEFSVMVFSVNFFIWEEGNDEYCVNVFYYEVYVL